MYFRISFTSNWPTPSKISCIISTEKLLAVLKYSSEFNRQMRLTPYTWGSLGSVCTVWQCCACVSTVLKTTSGSSSQNTVWKQCFSRRQKRQQYRAPKDSTKPNRPCRPRLSPVTWTTVPWIVCSKIGIWSPSLSSTFRSLISGSSIKLKLYRLMSCAWNRAHKWILIKDELKIGGKFLKVKYMAPNLCKPLLGPKTLAVSKSS